MVRKQLMILAVVAAALALIVAPAAAAPAIGGPTGLFDVPTADVLRPNEIGLSAHLISDVAVLGIGFAPVNDLEIGAGLVGFDGGYDAWPHLKIRLLAETADYPALAIGLNGSNVYVVGSKRIAGNALRAHFGVGTGKYDGPFLAIEKTLNPVSISTKGSASAGPVTTVIGEYVRHDFNIGIRFGFPNGMRIDLGFLGLDTLAGGISYTARF